MLRGTLRMPSSENRVIIACAGSGKTTRLVNEALTDRDRRIAIVTYTNNNTREIVKRFGELNSGIPKHVDVMTWFGFLLRECTRPYQRPKYDAKRIESLCFVNKQSTRGIAETNTKDYYFANGDLIYSDKIARFVIECQDRSSNGVTARLNQIYTDVFIDEFQDLVGWDLDVIEMLLQSGIRVTLVGDPRQHTYDTNPSRKHSQHLGVKVLDLVNQWVKKGLSVLEPMGGSHRCNGPICEFANGLWPGMDAMTALGHESTGHDGVFLVPTDTVDRYIRRFNPQVLRYDRRANAYGCEAVNFGAAKGLEFDRVLIVPTKPIKRYLTNGDVKQVEERSKAKLYVAITRARHSVAFVYDDASVVVTNRWQ